MRWSAFVLALLVTPCWAGDGVSLVQFDGWTFETNQLGAALAHVRAAGDVNNDGFGDALASAPLYDSANQDAGAVWFFLGSASGLSTTPAWTTSGPDQAGAGFGHSISTAGDVDRDGFVDVLVTAPGYDGNFVDEGAVWLYRGMASGLSTTPAWSFTGGATGSELTTAAYAGDLNHDGFDDVLVGAIEPGSAGRAYLFYGRAFGLAATPVIPQSPYKVRSQAEAGSRASIRPGSATRRPSAPRCSST